MATVAFKGSLTVFQIGSAASPPVYTTLGEVRSVGPLGQRNDLIEVTHMQSTAREYIGGLPDGMEIEVTCNTIPTDAGHVAAIAKVAAGTTAPFKYTMPSGGGSLSYTFAALVLGWNQGPTTPNEAVQTSFQLKVSGSITGPV